eukprot:Gb_07153 [translate_table: standard]
MICRMVKMGKLGRLQCWFATSCDAPKVLCNGNVDTLSQMMQEVENEACNRPYAMPTNLGTLCKDGKLKQALCILHKMAEEGIPVESYMYASVLQGCANTKALAEGRQVHANILKTGIERNLSLRTTLVSMYTKCGSLRDARLAFEKIPNPNAFLWNALIGAHAMHGFCEEALCIYYEMRRVGKNPDNFTFPAVLKACAGLDALQQGKDIHDSIIRCGFESDVFIGTALIDMYAKCKDIENARQVFDKMSERNVVSWTAMIAGYTRNGFDREALKLFSQMHLGSLIPSAIAIVSILPACARLAALQQGKEIHDYIIRRQFDSVIFVSNALIDMYAKCRNTDFARQVFYKMPQRNVISWTAIIAGYAQNGHAYEALQLFHQMQLADMKPNPITMTSVLPTCAHLAALQHGKAIHSYIIRRGFESDIFVGSALIDMYSKCGDIELAHLVFDKMSRRDVVSWNALIVGYGMHGHGENALELFNQMKLSGMKPDHVTFLAVLSACCHAGLVDEGWQYFDSMSLNYHTTPGLQHYACMVDLLGRAGRLDEAHDFIKKMPVEPRANVWGALLSACRTYCHIELGKCAAEHLFELEPENPGYYVLLSNIYAKAGKWHEVTRVRTMMKDKGLKKKPGCSWIEVSNRVHTFFVGDRSHPQSERIYAMLDSLAGQMKEAGYVPEIHSVLHDVEEDEKEYILCYHSEKLAVAFGIISTCPGAPIRVTKNLRVCGDCHSFIKYISKIVEREIIVRDANRFHHFKQAVCSCGDYW